MIIHVRHINKESLWQRTKFNFQDSGSNALKVVIKHLSSGMTFTSYMYIPILTVFPCIEWFTLPSPVNPWLCCPDMEHLLWKIPLFWGGEGKTPGHRSKAWNVLSDEIVKVHKVLDNRALTNSVWLEKNHTSYRATVDRHQSKPIKYYHFKSALRCCMW